MSKLRVNELETLQGVIKQVSSVADINTDLASYPVTVGAVTGTLSEFLGDGSGLSIPIVSVDGVTELPALSTNGKDTGTKAIVRGYYPTAIAPLGTAQPYGQGGGIFSLERGTDYVATPGLVIASTAETDAYWIRQFQGEVNVHWFGAKGDGSTDDTSDIQDAHDTGYNVFYPSGNYIISSTIQVRQGQKARGVKGLRFPDNELRSIITMNVADTAAFAQNVSTFTGQEDGFSAEDLYIISDKGILLNNLEDVIDDGTEGSNPYLMRSEFRRLTLKPITAGEGYGLALSKCFDFIIEQCETTSFKDHIILQGCDIGRVSTNRLTAIYRHGILELSCSTFGSQNWIVNNDMVQCSLSTARFIKSTARHVRIKDNYLEQQTGSCVGFIDIYADGVIEFGTNSPSLTRFSSVVVTDNRLDGHANATAFIYRLDGRERLLNTTIHDAGTTGAAPSVPWLVIPQERLPAMWNDNTVSRYDISGGRGTSSERPIFQEFKTKDVEVSNGKVTFDAESFVNLDRASLLTNSANDHVKLSEGGIALMPTLGTTLLHCVLPGREGKNNPYLKSGSSYNVKIIARTDNGTETLRAIPIVDGAGQGSSTDTALTVQNTAINITMSGAAVTSKVGVALYFQAASPTNQIIIESVSFEQV